MTLTIEEILATKDLNDPAITLTPKEREVIIAEMVKNDEIIRSYESANFKKNFYNFNKEVVGWPDIYEPLHKKVCDFIQDNIDKKMLLILLPRGTFKSSIITTGFPLWMIAKNPTTRGIIANATYPMATQFLGQVKDVLQKNERFKELYGDYATDAPVWRDDALSLNTDESYRTKEPTVTAIGVGSNYTGRHADWAILDDLVTRDNIRTMDRIQEVINFYKDVLDLVDPAPAGHKKVIVVGTTWHQSDLYSWIRDPEVGIEGDFAVLRLPAFGHFDENNRFAGEWGKSPLLFPVKLGWDVLEGLKRNQGSSHFSAQYLLDPVPPEDAMFKNIRYYEPDSLRGLKLNKFIAVDPALSEKKEADYSSMVCVGVDSKNVWYILDIWRDRVNPKELIDQIFMWDAKHKPITIATESVAFQRVIQFYLNEEMKRRNHRFPVTELRHTEQSKEERIRALQPRYESGSIFHPKAPPNSDLWRMEKFLKDELERFPRGKNDDLIDALASILEIAMPARAFTTRPTGARTIYPA